MLFVSSQNICICIFICVYLDKIQEQCTVSFSELIQIVQISCWRANELKIVGLYILYNKVCSACVKFMMVNVHSQFIKYDFNMNTCFCWRNMAFIHRYCLFFQTTLEVLVTSSTMAAAVPPARMGVPVSLTLSVTPVNVLVSIYAPEFYSSHMCDSHGRSCKPACYDQVIHL